MRDSNDPFRFQRSESSILGKRSEEGSGEESVGRPNKRVKITDSQIDPFQTNSETQSRPGGTESSKSKEQDKQNSLRRAGDEDTVKKFLSSKESEMLEAAQGLGITTQEFTRRFKAYVKVELERGNAKTFWIHPETQTLEPIGVGGSGRGGGTSQNGLDSSNDQYDDAIDDTPESRQQALANEERRARLFSALGDDVTIPNTGYYQENPGDQMLFSYAQSNRDRLQRSWQQLKSLGLEEQALFNRAENLVRAYRLTDNHRQFMGSGLNRG